MKKILFGTMLMALVGATLFFVSCKDEEKDPPLITYDGYVGSQVGPFTVNATILDDNGPLKSATLYYKKNEATSFEKVTMTKGDENKYSGQIPVMEEGDMIYLYIEAINSADLKSTSPAKAPAETHRFEVGGINYSDIVINEIWAGAPSDNDKFIELFNKGAETVDISGIYFERNAEGQIGLIPDSTYLAAGAYYILGTKNNTSNPSNPDEPYDNSLSTGFSAKKSIRFIMFDPNGNEVDRFLRGSEDNLDVTISDLAPGSFSRIPNGTGEWKIVTNPTLRAANDATGAADIPQE